MNRRDFLLSSAAALAVAPLSSRAADAAAPAAVAPSATAEPAKPRRANKKGFMFAMLKSPAADRLPLREKFQLLRDAGFAGVEVNSAMNQAEVLAAREATQLEIPSVVIATHWAKPLSDPNPTAREVGLEGLKQGLRDAKAYGASSVLLVPGRVTKEVSYADCFTRSVAEIKKALPLAEELGVAIAIENVWNAFLLSPLEAVEYVDQFKSPFVRWHFDVGNVINTGWPEHWIHALGPRIVKIHVKEFSLKLRDTQGLRTGFNVDLMAGDSDWPAVMPALDAIGYRGWLIAEQWRAPNLTDADYLAGLSRRMDAILAV
jgi:hexulose-6-phosphate isomerase